MGRGSSSSTPTASQSRQIALVLGAPDWNSAACRIARFSLPGGLGPFLILVLHREGQCPRQGLIFGHVALNGRRQLTSSTVGTLLLLRHASGTRFLLLLPLECCLDGLIPLLNSSTNRPFALVIRRVAMLEAVVLFANCTGKRNQFLLFAVFERTAVGVDLRLL